MNVWKKQTTQWVLNGKRVPPRTPKAKRTLIVSKRFYGTLSLANGKSKQTPLTDDRSTSEALLSRLQGNENEKRANGADRYYDDRQRPIGDLLAEYESYLESKSNTSSHVRMTVSRCRKVLNETKAKTIGDLDSGRILKALSQWRKRKTKSLGVATSNHYLIAIKSFSRWLWHERKSPDDPLAGLRKLNGETDRRRVRRALTPDEISKLTSIATISRQAFHGDDYHLTPTDRTLLYLTAALTGLRANELASLTKSSFDFERMTFTLEAFAAKNRKRTTLPLHPHLAAKLQTWFASFKRDELWAGGWVRKGKAGKFLKRDLKRAKIHYRDEQGRYADFHSLRYTFITSLAKAGVHPAKAQRLARHSTINLTMNVYTQLDADDLRAAIDSLPTVKNSTSDK